MPYSVAAWIEGSPLTEAAVSASAQTKLAWVGDIAAALTYLHHVRNATTPHGIVHRDIKPSNVRVRDDGTAVLVDFGVARPVDHHDMTEGVGTYLCARLKCSQVPVPPQVSRPMSGVSARSPTGC